MITIITGALIGATIGAVAGNGMEVKRNKKGRKVIKRIDWKKGINGIGEDVLVGAAITSTLLGAVVFAQAATEFAEEQWKESEEYYDGKRDELLYRTHKVIDYVMEEEYSNKKEEYLRMAEIARNYEGDLSGVIISNRDGMDLNKFEAYGLKCMTDNEISDVLWNGFEKKSLEVKNDATDLINEGSWWELEEIETNLDILEKELF